MSRPALSWLRGLTLVLCALALGGCLSREARQAKRMEGNFDLGQPGSGWLPVSPGGADKAFRNKDLGAVIYADSNCGVRYEDAPLPKLAMNLTFGVSATEPTQTSTWTLDGRDAYTARTVGALDGVPVAMGVTVLKKDFCVYDLVLIAPPGAPFDAAWPAFDAVAQGFRTRP